MISVDQTDDDQYMRLKRESLKNLNRKNSDPLQINPRIQIDPSSV